MTVPSPLPPSTDVILIVEDSAGIRTLQRFLLARAGWPVVECPDLPDAEAYLAAHAPAVIVLDLNLPGGPGLSLLPGVDRTRTAVLVMTGMTQQRIMQLSGAHADAFMEKPFEPEAFVAQVSALARSRRPA